MAMPVVGAGVEQDVDVADEEPSARIGQRAQCDRPAMTAAHAPGRVGTIDLDEHRHPTACPGEQRSGRFERHLLLPPEAASDHHRLHQNVFRIHSQHWSKSIAHEERTLRRRPHVTTAVDPRRRRADRFEEPVRHRIERVRLLEGVGSFGGRHGERRLVGAEGAVEDEVAGMGTVRRHAAFEGVGQREDGRHWLLDQADGRQCGGER